MRTGMYPKHVAYEHKNLSHVVHPFSTFEFDHGGIRTRSLQHAESVQLKVRPFKAKMDYSDTF